MQKIKKWKPTKWANKSMKSELARFKRDASIKGGSKRNILKEF